MNQKLKISLIKNIASGFINSLITLTLLLIAPLGLASVITNTIAVGISTFVVCTCLDLISAWLIQNEKPLNFPYQDSPYDNPLSSTKRTEIERRNHDNY